METNVAIFNLLSDITFSGVLEGLFYLLLLIFAIHAGIVVYHWFTFGTSRTTAAAATITYLGVSAFIIVFMSSLVATM